MADALANALSLPDHVVKLLQDLQQQSMTEEAQIKAPGGGYEKMKEMWATDPSQASEYGTQLFRDKFIALEEDKALFVCQIIRATGALNVVEAGTSYGVSTIYLASAIRRNAIAAGKKPGEAKVIATEHEPAKAAKARENWKLAGETVEPWIDLREGDIRETLKTDVPTVDVLLLDIWTPMVLPTLKVLEPKFRPGTVLIADNTVRSSHGYKEFFDYVNAPGSPYTTVTMPYEGGMELTVYRPN